MNDKATPDNKRSSAKASVLSAARLKEWSRKKPFRAIVDADLLRRAYACVSQEATRYYLTGVHFEPHPDGGVLMVSTDGHRLIAIRDANGVIENGTAIVKLGERFREDMDPSRRKKKKHHRIDSLPRKVVIESNRIALMGSTNGKLSEEEIAASFKTLREPTGAVVSLQWSETLIDGKFPDWRRVIPLDLDPSAPIGEFNVDVLAGVAAALNPETKSVSIIAQRDGLSSPHLVRGFSPAIDGFGIIMPMRGSASKALPMWPEFVKQVAPRPATPTPETPAAPPRGVRWERFLGIPVRMVG